MSVTISAEAHAEIRRRLVAGHSIRKIAFEFGVAKQTVQDEKKRLGELAATRTLVKFGANMNFSNTPTRAYHARATGKLYPAGMNYLSDLILRPGIEKLFGPLLLYRGCMTPGKAHRLWNMAVFMMAHECETLADGLKIINNEKYSQLCGPVKPPEKIWLKTFFTRLHDNPGVTRNIKGLGDYVKSLGLGECFLQRVDRFSNERFCAPWRVSLHPEAGIEPPERGIPQSKQLFYPFIAHDHKKPDDGMALVKLINMIVPVWLPEQIRADVCQDLIVDILTGKIDPRNARDHLDEKMKNVFKMHGKYEGGHLKMSFDAPVPGTDGKMFTDII